jgi:integrase
VSPTTINRELGTLSTFLNFARKRRHIRCNPAERVEPLPVPKWLPRVLDKKQVRSLLDAADAPVPFHGRGGKGKGNARQRLTPLRDMILFAVNTGARLGEMLYMEWGDVDLKGRAVFFRNKPEHRLKDYADRKVKANRTVLRVLARRKLATQGARWIFPSAVGGVIDRANALRELKGAALAAAVPLANWQALRRTFLTHCAMAGMPPFILKDIAGHSSIRTTETFYVNVGGGGSWAPPSIVA